MSTMNANSHLEQENNRLTDSLRDKVSALKSLGIEIGDEARNQNRYISDMDDDFEASKSLLGSTMRRLGLVSKSGGHRFTCYLILFAFTVFLVIYWLVSRK